MEWPGQRWPPCGCPGGGPAPHPAVWAPGLRCGGTGVQAEVLRQTVGGRHSEPQSGRGREGAGWSRGGGRQWAGRTSADTPALVAAAGQLRVLTREGSRTRWRRVGSWWARTASPPPRTDFRHVESGGGRVSQTHRYTGTKALVMGRAGTSPLHCHILDHLPQHSETHANGDKQLDEYGCGCSEVDECRKKREKQ